MALAYPCRRYAGLTGCDGDECEDVVELVRHLKSDLAAAGLMPLYHALSWTYWKLSVLPKWLAPSAAFLLLEYLIGRRSRASWRDVSYNFAFLIIYVLIIEAMTPLLHDAVVWSRAALGGPYFAGALTADVSSGLLAVIALQITYLFLYDFFNYWYHRLQHQLPVLWVTHKLHHVDQNMGVTTTLKTHPFSILGRTVMVAFPLGLLFDVDRAMIFWFAYSTTLFEHFIHTNIDCHFGPFNYVLCSPNQHRVHHSTLPEHRDKNFATYFPIIDLLFGTYCPPVRHSVPPTGVDSGETYPSLWAAYVQPLTDWWQMGRYRKNLRV